MKQGRVYLIGAGCGKADLLTLRGKKLLEDCEAVVYDDLIDPAILDFTPADALRVYMGKREGRHSARQEDISAKLVELASQGLTVARLKGGDPFVFGRGGEEILALQRADIPYEEVPGISSAIAIPAEAGIPVTHRTLSRSIHIVTGHTADTPDGLPADLPQLAACGGTLIFLMGLNRLGDIARELMAYGKAPDTPAAVISGGNSSHPAAVRGTLADIAEKAEHILSPAVIVVGAVAALDLSSTLPRPLDHVRVGVTGTERMIQRLTQVLAPLGAEIIPLARLRVQPLPPDSRLLTLISEEKKWLVFTSPTGVSVFFKQLRALRMDIRRLFACRFAVIGPATARVLEDHGIIPDLCPAAHTSEDLAQALVETASPRDALYLLRSAKGAAVLRKVPEQAGFSVTDIPLYDTAPDPNCLILENTRFDALDYLVFSSAVGTEEFFRQYHGLPPYAVPVCIGPVTAQAVRKHTGREILMAEDTDADEIAAVIFTDKYVQKTDF